MSRPNLAVQLPLPSAVELSPESNGPTFQPVRPLGVMRHAITRQLGHAMDFPTPTVVRDQFEMLGEGVQKALFDRAVGGNALSLVVVPSDSGDTLSPWTTLLLSTFRNDSQLPIDCERTAPPEMVLEAIKAMGLVASFIYSEAETKHQKSRPDSMLSVAALKWWLRAPADMMPSRHFPLGLEGSDGMMNVAHLLGNGDTAVSRVEEAHVRGSNSHTGLQVIDLSQTI